MTKKTRRLKLHKGKRGGKADVKLPFTYYEINLDFLKMNPMLNEWLKNKMNECVCNSNKKCSYQTSSSTSVTTNPDDWVISGNQKIIISARFEVLYGSEDLNNPEIFMRLSDQFLGFCKLDFNFNDVSSIVGVFDFCVTSPPINPSDGQPYTGYGKVLFSVIMTYIEYTYFEKDPTIWLAINTDNKYIKKVCNIFTTFGFGHQYITRIDPFGTNHMVPILSLSKKLNEHTTAYYENIKTLQKCLILLNGFDKEDEKYFKVRLNIDRIAQYRLRLIPFLNKDRETHKLEQGGFAEYWGNFRIDHIEFDLDENVVCDLVLPNNILGGTKLGSTYINKGNADNTGPMHWLAHSWHSHPFAMYVLHNVIIAPPSGVDCVNFLLAFNMTSIENSPSQCHFVISVEGIYCISLTEYVISNLKNILENLDGATRNNIASLMEFDYNYRSYDWCEYSIGKSCLTLKKYEEKYQIKKLKEYEEFVKNRKITLNINNSSEDVQIFNIEFKSWRDLYVVDDYKTDTFFEVLMPKIHNNAFIPSDDFKIIPTIHGDEHYKELY